MLNVFVGKKKQKKLSYISKEKKINFKSLIKFFCCVVFYVRENGFNLIYFLCFIFIKEMTTKAKWTFSNETVFDLMLCRVEKEWFTTIIGILKSLPLCDLFSIRQNDCSLLEYALRNNHFQVSVFLMQRFNEYIIETESVSFSMSFNRKGDSLLHLLVRYNCFELMEQTPVLLQFIDSFMHFSNGNGETFLDLVCKSHNKKIILAVIMQCPYVLDYILRYLELHKNESLMSFICDQCCFLLPKRFYI